jgi:hypothetical protein
MAHFANGYEGDTVSLNYILQAQSHEDVFIPGVTENPNISVSVSGEVAYIDIPADASIGEGTVGGKVEFNSKGVSTHPIPMTNALTISDVIPHANFATVCRRCCQFSLDSGNRETPRHDEPQSIDRGQSRRHEVHR